MSPVIDLRDPALRKEWQLDLPFTDTVPIPSRSRKTAQEHRGRAETEQMIVDVLRSANRPLTRLEIARALGRVKTPWLITVVSTLAQAGQIVAIESEYRGFQCWKYQAVAPVDQLRMW
jgi:hypothetical protein